METQSQTNEKTRAPEEVNLEEAIHRVNCWDLNELISETSGAYALFANSLDRGTLDNDDVYTYQNVIEMLLAIKDVRAKYGQFPKIKIQSLES